jgi:pimeloyl-ACP methyl ester carboxylesterase
MVREQRVRLTHGVTRYLEAGSGWPVVLLHGFPLSADMWRPQLEAPPDGWRYLAPDLRGFGPAAAAPATSMDELAAAVVEWLDALRIEKATIGGLSMGGYVTFALLRRARERASAVILADTRATADTEQGRAARTTMIETVRAKGVAAVADEMMPKLLGETTHRERPQVERVVREIAAANAPEGLAGAIEAMRERPDSTPGLAKISVPALVLVGEEDVLTPPSDAEAMRAALARGRLVEIPRAGHLSNLEAPGEFSAALADFLLAPL